MSLKFLLDNSQLHVYFLYSICNSNNKLLRILDCYVKLSGKCTTQFKNYFVNSSMNVKQIYMLVHQALEK